MTIADRIRWYGTSLMVLTALGVVSPALAAARVPGRTTSPHQSLSPAEAWVLKQIVADKDADLEEMPGVHPKDRTRPVCEEAKGPDRVLRAAFVENLLVGNLPGLVMPRNRIHIKNAIVSGAMNLRNVQIPFEVRFDDCDFAGEVEATASTFQRSLSFGNSKFHAPANFLKARISDLVLVGAHFCKAAKLNRGACQ